MEQIWKDLYAAARAVHLGDDLSLDVGELLPLFRDDGLLPPQLV